MHARRKNGQGNNFLPAEHGFEVKEKTKLYGNNTIQM
jgi:hypothetical protein